MEIKVKQRISLSIFFFLSGICFASWASRIPTIKDTLQLNEAELGSLLFTMPISSLIGLPISGWLVEKYDSRLPLIIGFIFHAVFLFFIGISDTVILFTIAIFMFALSNRITNIAINTQAIAVQKLFIRKINGSFHGLWSLGGIAGVGITTLLVAFEIGIMLHFVFIGVLSLILTFLSYKHLLKEDKSKSTNRLVIRKPDPQILSLGLLIFFASICEGGMFDWSGVYFKEVVNVEIFTSGYLIFMTSMALSRFVSDWFIHKLGMQTMYIISALLIATGLGMAILYPTFWVAMCGFTLVGAGTASVVPMTFLLAGSLKRFSPGIAISFIGTFGLVGMLIGPPLIGYIAHLLGLRYSFVFLTLAGLLLIPASKYFFIKKEN